MYKKILVVEDQQSISKGLKSILKDMNIDNVDVSDSCDNALLKVKASLVKKNPIELLITDLSFEEDYLTHTISSGDELIKHVKKVQPNLKIIVFSIENKIGKIKKLINEYAVDAFIAKGRRESQDIKNALNSVSKGKKYYSDSILQLLRNSDNISDVNSNDTLILKLLASGLKQKAIPQYFKDNNIASGSKRSIEYRIQELKIIFGAETLPQLIGIAKDTGLI